MIDNLLGGDDDDEPDEGATDDMDGGLFDGDEGGDDLMGGGDDLMGGDDDLMDGGDEMGFDEMDDGGSATSAEMDNRIDELENEVASLSSTVNTVKSENEQISESLGDVEENIRKLLEVYEMVTRGVNPFVDENEMGDAFGGGGGAGGGGSSGGSMGLFGDGDAEEETEEIDESVANADANEFFDEDLDDDGDDFDDFDDFDAEENDEDESLDDGFGGDDFDDSGEFDEELDSDFDDEDDFDSGFDDAGDFDDDAGDFDDGGDNGGGKSFEELKAEYDSGEADWDDDDAAAGDSGPEPASEIDAEPVDTPAAGMDDPVAEMDDSDGLDDEFTADDLADTESPAAANTSQTLSEAQSGSPPEAQSGNTAHSPVDGGKPYLETLPAGYLADIVVMDWLEFLVEEAGTDGAARTIAYYEAIEWVDGEAAETLQTFLNGFGGEIEEEPEPRSSLTVSHHNTSLRYISRIANPDMEMVAFDERMASPPSDVEFGDRSRGNMSQRGFGMKSDGGHELAERSTHDRVGRTGGEYGFNWNDGGME